MPFGVISLYVSKSYIPLLVLTCDRQKKRAENSFISSISCLGPKDRQCKQANHICPPKRQAGRKVRETGNSSHLIQIGAIFDRFPERPWVPRMSSSDFKCSTQERDVNEERTPFFFKATWMP